MVGNLSEQNFFGATAFIITGIVIAFVLSPMVPQNKEVIANVILGNVLGWPAIVLAYYFGTSRSSADKDDVLKQIATSNANHNTPEPTPVPNPLPEKIYKVDNPDKG